MIHYENGICCNRDSSITGLSKSRRWWDGITNQEAGRNAKVGAGRTANDGVWREVA